jgi:hypothetical protein
MEKECELGKLHGQDWVGPFQIDEVLSGCLDDSFPKPPETQCVYLISEKPWRNIQRKRAFHYTWEVRRVNPLDSELELEI